MKKEKKLREQRVKYYFNQKVKGKEDHIEVLVGLKEDFIEFADSKGGFIKKISGGIIEVLENLEKKVQKKKEKK